MGTSQSFYNILGTDLTQTQIKNGLEKQQIQGPVALARSDASPWLLLFEENLCEGYTASSEDARKISEAFDAPVAAFALFDSDVLYVSYADHKNSILFDCEKPNGEEIEEEDAALYEADFPAFLYEYCREEDQQKLRDIWAAPDYVFADDRLRDLCKVLHMETLFSAAERHLPKGFYWVDC